MMMMNTVPGMNDFNQHISVDFKKTLEAVHSVQQIENRIGSSGTQFTDANNLTVQQTRPRPNQQISARNIKVAKMALRDRSPSYLNSKLVSRTSLQDNVTRAKVETQMSQTQKDALEAEVNEHVLQNALKQREQWREAYQLNDQ